MKQFSQSYNKTKHCLKTNYQVTPILNNCTFIWNEPGTATKLQKVRVMTYKVSKARSQPFSFPRRLKSQVPRWIPFRKEKEPFLVFQCEPVSQHPSSDLRRIRSVPRLFPEANLNKISHKSYIASLARLDFLYPIIRQTNQIVFPW